MVKKQSKTKVIKMRRCLRCGKRIEHPRRGMCLNCYRFVTGLS